MLGLRLTGVGGPRNIYIRVRSSKKNFTISCTHFFRAGIMIILTIILKRQLIYSRNYLKRQDAFFQGWNYDNSGHYLKMAINLQPELSKRQDLHKIFGQLYVFSNLTPV